MTDQPPEDLPAVLEDQQTGEHYVVLDQRRRKPLLFGLSPWQLAVLGAYLVTLVLFVGLIVYGHNTRENTKRLNKSICAQAVYLDGVRAPNPLAQARVNKLTGELRSLAKCPRAPREIPAPPG